MTELLETYSLQEILIFAFMLAIGIKQVIELFSFFKGKARAKLEEEQRSEELKKNIKEISDNNNKELKAISENTDKQIKNMSEHTTKYFDRLDKKLDGFSERIDVLEEGQKTMLTLSKEFAEINLKFSELTAQQNDILNDIKLLKESDREQLKNFFVRQYHFFCEKCQSIDDFSMDSLEKLYKKYDAQGEDASIASLIAQIRKLPRSNGAGTPHYDNDDTK